MAVEQRISTRSPFTLPDSWAFNLVDLLEYRDNLLDEWLEWEPPLDELFKQL